MSSLSILTEQHCSKSVWPCINITQYMVLTVVIRQNLRMAIAGTNTLSLRAASDAVTDQTTITSCNRPYPLRNGPYSGPCSFETPLLTCQCPLQSPKKVHSGYVMLKFDQPVLSSNKYKPQNMKMTTLSTLVMMRSCTNPFNT